jgi:D-alanyl-D-alanine dipeptidase
MRQVLAGLLVVCGAALGPFSSSGPAAASPDAPVPPVSDAARAAGLVDVRTVVPDAIIALRYVTPDNFVGVPLYPPGARCLVAPSMAAGLAKAADAVRPNGDVLVFWDCYRPHDVQVEMFEAVPDRNWVAQPGRYAHSHETGLSVDATLAKGGALLDMGTDFDDFTPRARADATEGVSPPAQANRELLRDAMASGGLTVYSGEWWHFDAPGAQDDHPILDVPVN